MTAAQLQSSLLPMLGVEAISDAPPQVLDRIVADLNTTIREIYTEAPDGWLGSTPQAEVLRAPTTASLTATLDSKVISFAGYASWMAGCTIVIDGDPQQNMLTADAAAGATLVYPYSGTTGVHNATVYQDALNLHTSLAMVIPPVMLRDNATYNGGWELTPLGQRDRMADQGGYGGRWDGSVHGVYPRQFPLLSREKQVTRPYSYDMDQQNKTFNGVTSLRLTLNTLPDQKYWISFKARTFLTVSTVAGDTRTEFLPMGMDYAIMVPWLRYKFATWPDSRLSQNDLQGEFDAARMLLQKTRVPVFKATAVSISGGW